MKIKSLILATLMALLPSVSPAAETLYGVWDSFPASHNVIYRIDPTNAVVSNIMPITLPGNLPVYDVQGLAARPGDNTLFLFIRKEQFSQFTNILATIDPQTGICHEIGTFSQNQSIQLLAFRSNSILYGASEGFGDNRGSLFQINQSTGAETFLFAMDPDQFGTAIGWHPSGILYHTRDNNDPLEVFEAVYPDAQIVSPIGIFNNYHVALAMSYSTATNQLFLVDGYTPDFKAGESNLYTVNIQSGQRTLIGDMYSQLPVSSFPRNAGIAFINPITISGNVSYCAGSTAVFVPNATVTLNGTSSASTLTDGNGHYAFTNLVSGGNYTVTVTKPAVVAGSTGAAINNVDFLAVQRHFLGIQPLFGCHLQAGDVNGDGQVNNVDATAINRFYLGFSTGTANVGKYKFTPATYTYTGITSDQVNQNFGTVVLGDVTAPFVEPTQ